MQSHPAATIIVDVEGVLFKTRLTTLKSARSGFFHDILSNPDELRRHIDSDGHLFLDRDSTIFPIILNFLRDGPSLALPSDEFYLARILQEARFFRLHDLCDILERKMSYGELPLRKPSNNQQMSRNSHPKAISYKAKKDKGRGDAVSLEGRSLPPTPPQPTPILNEYSRRMSVEEPPMPMKKSTLEKRQRKGRQIESISLPRNFAHVAHVGWNGSGVILQRHLLAEEGTVRAIIDAAGEADLTPVYNVVSGGKDEYGSHSVEVFLAGPHMNTKDPSPASPHHPDLYSRPQKRPPKPPAKPPLTQKPTLKNT